MFRKTVPDNRSENAETSFAEFRCCSRHDQIPQNGDRLGQRDSQSVCIDVLEIRGIGTSDTDKRKECSFKYSLRHRQPV